MQLARQFLGESFIVCFISFAFAIVLATAALPVFNDLANKRLSLSYLADTQLIAGFIGLFLITGFAAGFYPALVLSGFNPIQTLYNRVKLSGKNYLSKSLVVVQFALAALLIIMFAVFPPTHPVPVVRVPEAPVPCEPLWSETSDGNPLSRSI